MPLSVGDRLGSYEIHAAIGAGGMGEVYGARDTKLNRDVAIKVLPSAFAPDVERMARFKREAQVLASLNHPNIGAIYGFEESEGIQALVLEFVDGPTLADRIASGTIPLDDASSIAKQIVEALEAAHEQGIIHRDLKPANIKLRPDGTVKVLDFGLAKMIEGPVEAGHYGQQIGPDSRSVRLQPNQTMSPTITTPAMTQLGVILGTAAYMSPEQAKGRPADKRSDVWAFGCVLFEMLTGRRAFDGDDVHDTLAAVLRGQASWDTLPPDVPMSIRTLLTRCLERDPRRRISDIAVARFVLDEQAALAAPAINGAAAVAPSSRRGTVAALAAAVIATAAVAATVAWVFWPQAAPSPPVARFGVALDPGVEFTSINRKSLAISPDGSQLVFVANNRLYRRAVGDLVAQAIPGTEHGAVSNPVFSPDGKWLAFHAITASEVGLKRISISGGSSTLIVRTESPFGISWNEGGIVYASFDGRILRVAPAGGTPEQLVQLDSGQRAWGPQILPGGDAILFTLITTDAKRSGEVVVQSLASGRRTTVVPSAEGAVVDGVSDAMYVPSGHLLFAISGTLYAVRFDAATHTAIGEPVPIASGVLRTTSRFYSQFAASDSGMVVYLPGPINAGESVRSTIAISDPRGSTTSLKLRPERYSHPRVSPDGTQLAVAVEHDNGSDISIYDLAETSSLRRLTIEGQNRFPVWSGDGQRVAYQSDRQGDLGIFWQRADGTGDAERLTTAARDVEHRPESFSRDGAHLLVTERRGQRFTLHVLSMRDKTIAPLGDVRSRQPIGAVFSPDGRWIAYGLSGEGEGLYSQDNGVFIQPFPTGPKVQVPKVRIDYHPAWSPDGSALFFVSAGRAPLVMVDVRTRQGLSFGTPVQLPESVVRPRLLNNDVRGYDVMRNGRIIGMVSGMSAENSPPQGEIHVVLNWPEELNRLASAK